MKKGYSLIELLLVLAIIGVIATIGYQFGAKAMMKAKAQKVVSSLQEIKRAIANTLAQTGGYYQSTGTANTNYPVASPQPLPNPDPGNNCGNSAGSTPNNLTIEYYTGDGVALDTTCYGLRTEKALHENLVSIGMKWNDSTHDFRLPSVPIAHISFPFEVAGVRAIRIYGIPGDLAFEVFKILNGSKSISNTDGASPNKPVLLAKLTTTSDGGGGDGGDGGGGDSGGSSGPTSSANYGAGTEKGCLTGSSGGGDSSSDSSSDLSVLEAVNCIVSGSKTRSSTYFYLSGDEDKVKMAPRVILYYTYSFGDDANVSN